MHTLKTVFSVMTGLALTAAVTMLILARTPFDRLDARVAARGEDPEAGLEALEYAVLAGIVLVIVAAGAATLGGVFNNWIEKIPGQGE